MLQPKHTLKTVLHELVAGLESGEVVLREYRTELRSLASEPSPFSDILGQAIRQERERCAKLVEAEVRNYTDFDDAELLDLCLYLAHKLRQSPPAN